VKASSVEDIYVAVGRGNMTANDVLRAVFPGDSGAGGKAEDKDAAANAVPSKKHGKGQKKDDGVPIRGLIPGMAVHFAHCCHPLPGERIVGIVTTGKGVTVHTIDCQTLENFQESPERWVDLAWSTDSSDDPYTGRLHIMLANEPGSLGALSTTIGRNRANISNLKIIRRSLDFFEMLIDLEVSDVRHLTDVMAAMRAMPEVTAVERART
jgi:GTP pyrophosphokinase